MKHTTHKAFTMVELIFVIIILGIVASIGSEIIAKTYESYIVQRAQYKATSKTELALTQIANRLRYAIPGTIGFRADNNVASVFHIITEGNTGNDTVLQWVGADGDSFEAITTASRRPGWSGFCDIDAYAGGTNFPTPGSNTVLAKTIITNLGGNIASANIFFPHSTAAYGIADSAAGGEAFTLDAALPNGIQLYERYKFAWSSYALSVEGGDLFLYHHFTPDIGVPLAGSKHLLLKNVTNFRFKGSEGSLRIKICKKEQIGMDANSTIHACKEKVIF